MVDNDRGGASWHSTTLSDDYKIAEPDLEQVKSEIWMVWLKYEELKIAMSL